MRTAFRNIISFIFLILGLSPILFVLFFALQQHSIRYQMKEKMEQAALHTIMLADNEIQWAKAGKEIWVEGKMFDIKSIEHKEGITIFNGLFDEDETLLKQNLKANFEKDQAKQNQLFSQLFQSLQGIYFENSIYHLNSNNKSTISFTHYTSRLHSNFLETPTPPPLI